MKIKYLECRKYLECEVVTKDEGWKCKQGSHHKGSCMPCEDKELGFCMIKPVVKQENFEI